MTDFHDLYVKYSKDIYRFALYLSADKNTAEEIVAETFARALLSKVPLIPISEKSYLLSIARNYHLETLRKNKRYTELSPDTLDSKINLHTNLEHKVEIESLYNYLLTFPELDRTALLLRSDGVSYDEITKILNISLPVLKVKIHRIRMKLLEWRKKED